MWMLLAACSEPDHAVGPRPQEDLDPHIAELCVETWPVDRCPDDCPDPVDQVWAEGLLLKIARRWDLEVDDVRARVHVLRVRRPAQNQVVLDARYDLGWASFVWRTSSDSEVDPPTADEAADALREPPQIDPTSTPMQFSEVADTLASCEAEYGVTFDPTELWCGGTLAGTGDSLVFAASTSDGVDPDHDPRFSVRLFGYADGRIICANEATWTD